MKIDLDALFNLLDEYGDLPVGLCDRINALPSISDGWISTSDDLPKEDGYVWVYDHLSEISEKVWYDDALPNTFKEYYTHWQPLPPAPTK